MITSLRDVKDGYILAKDVEVKSSRLIMFKDTVLTKAKIDLLRAFLVESVDVIIPASNQMDSINASNKKNFIEFYLHSVNEYKKLFLNWQSGLSTNVSDVRAIIVPLLEQAMKNNEDVFNLHTYSSSDDYMYHHAVSVGLYSGILAKHLGLAKGEILQIALAGCLCDVGMAKMAEGILQKESKLSAEEYGDVKKHPILGYQMLQGMMTLKKDAQVAIIQHHERLDGSGYPLGDKTNHIHFYARIIAVADTYHAMTTDKNYQARQSPFKVLDIIKYDQFGKFDLNVTNALTSKIANIGIGSKVILSNLLSGEIVFMNPQFITRPIVKIFETGELIDLDRVRSIYIEEVY
ncbi:HD-GYP domain-containing protein [Bacillus massiliigorillae]|uniref:HD-GYP domain-containing protein n=1 Tax=Bacillus massiliigorillae TaxID=1243664 RepID=UPI00039C08B1|nr:HD-GYP domain-containing protein [Bacillus massiliigorillae]